MKLDAHKVAQENGIKLTEVAPGLWCAFSRNHNTYSSTPERAVVGQLRRARGMVLMNGVSVTPAALAQALLPAPTPVVDPDREKPPLAESGDEPPADGDAQPPAPEAAETPDDA